MDKQVVFFEWSDLKRVPIGFASIEAFVNFCIESNIKVTKKNLRFFQNNSFIFAVCKPNVNELILSGDDVNLRKNFNKHKNSSK